MGVAALWSILPGVTPKRCKEVHEMPVISVTLGQGQTTSEQRRELVERFTNIGAEITRLPQQAFTILINELSVDSIGVGGKTLEQIRASGS
jgi:4-oxalocrotonate tautomerase